MTRLVCALCGRPTVPFCLLGGMAIGPKCAARAGLTPSKAKKNRRVKFLARPAPVKGPQNLDLFEGLAA